MKKALIILTLIFLSKLCISNNGGILGKIKDSQNNEDLAGVKITLSNSDTLYSDFEGSFLIQNLPAGKYTIQFSIQGYKDLVNKEIEIKESETTVIEFNITEL